MRPSIDWVSQKGRLPNSSGRRSCTLMDGGTRKIGRTGSAISEAPASCCPRMLAPRQLPAPIEMVRNAGARLQQLHCDHALMRNASAHDRPQFADTPPNVQWLL